MSQSEDNTYMEIKVTRLEGRLDSLERKVDEFLSELRLELKTIKENTNTLQTLHVEYAYQKETTSRLFTRLEKAEGEHDKYDKFINQYEGAKKLAWVIWTIMGSVVTYIIIKIISGGN